MLVGDPQQLNPVILLGELTNKSFVAGIMYRMSMITEKIQSIKRILPVMQ